MTTIKKLLTRIGIPCMLLFALFTGTTVHAKEDFKSFNSPEIYRMINDKNDMITLIQQSGLKPLFFIGNADRVDRDNLENLIPENVRHDIAKDIVDMKDGDTYQAQVYISKGEKKGVVRYKTIDPRITAKHIKNKKLLTFSAIAAGLAFLTTIFVLMPKLFNFHK